MKINATFLKDAGFYTIVAVGAYLSIAAITAIPDLRQAPIIPEEVSVERLKTSLTNSLQESQRRLAQSPAPTAPASPAPANPAPAAPAAPAGIAGIAAANTEAQLRAGLLNSLRRERETVATRLQQEWEAGMAHRRIAIEDAVLAYETQATRPGTRERRDHFLAIVAWYRKGSGALDARVESLRGEVAAIDRDIAGVVAGETGSEIKDLATARKKRLTVTDGASQGGAFDSVPARAALGQRWDGVFGWVAKWLMRTESLELALITGMLGFGLLGAATSSFVRGTQTSVRGGPIVDQFTSLILSGVAAAFAIFLAVKGGLAVFSSTEADPNPYVLLLTCFVAAVYREDAWERVRKMVGQEADDEEPAPRPQAGQASHQAPGEPRPRQERQGEQRQEQEQPRDEDAPPLPGETAQEGMDGRERVRPMALHPDPTRR